MLYPTFVKKLLLVIALLLFSQPVYSNMEEELAYAHACEELTVTYPVVANCAGIQPPYIIYTKLVRWRDKIDTHTDGMYISGEPFIFVYPNLRDRVRVTIHEMAHYIMYETGVDKGMDVCGRERAARRVAGHMWGAPEKAVYGCR